MQRKNYLDNLKVMLTILVIFHHSGLAYGDGGGWAYTPSNPNEFMPWIWHFFSTNAAFFMGLFFMISGYFVPQSFDKQSFGPFIGKKAVRLLIPMAAMTVLLTVLGGTLDSGHTWFLSSLFLFCLVYAFIRLAAKDKTASFSNNLNIGWILAMAAALGVGSYSVRQFFQQDYWVHWSFFKFEPVHYLQYATMFAIGVLAGRNNWFERLTDRTGRAALYTGVLLCVGNYLRGNGAWSGFVWRWFGIYESVLCVTLCIGLVWLFRKYGNWSGAFWQWCSHQAYGAYIVHLLLIIIIQHIFDGVWMGALGKFVFISVASTIASFGLTWLLRLIPGVKKVM